MPHTILLMQPTKSANSKTYADFNNLGECIDYVCNQFEKRLKELNPTVRQISYELQDIYNYVDSMQDMALLTFNGGIRAYEPQDREAIKRHVYQHLRKQVAG